MDSCAHNFEQKAISEWLRTHSCCPISRKPLVEADLVPNHTLSERIDRWKWQRENDGIMWKEEEENDEDDPTWTSSDDDVEKGNGEVRVPKGSRTKGRRSSRRSRTRKHNYNEIPADFMLLPQEREVLAIVQSKEAEARSRLHKKRCCYRTMITTLGAVMLILGGYLYYRYVREEDEDV